MNQDQIRFDNLLVEAKFAAHAGDHQKAYELLMKAAHMQWKKTQEPERLAS